MLYAIPFMRFFYETHPIQFSLFPNYLLPKLIGCVPAMNKIEKLKANHPCCFVPSLVEYGPVV